MTPAEGQETENITDKPKPLVPPEKKDDASDHAAKKEGADDAKTEADSKAKSAAATDHSHESAAASGAHAALGSDGGAGAEIHQRETVVTAPAHVIAPPSADLPASEPTPASGTRPSPPTPAGSGFDPGTDDPRLALSPSVVRMPRPGDAGYAAPARVAQPAGQVLRPEHYDYSGSTANQGVAVTGQPALAMPAPAYQTVSTDAAGARPSQLSAQTATLVFRKMIGELRAWVADLPHEMTGELAVAAQFIRDLNARRAAQNTATALGRTLEPDEVDAAVNVPPAEFFQLRHMASSMMTAIGIFETALTDLGAPLTGDAKATIDQIKAEFSSLAVGPQSPGDAEIHPDDEAKPTDAQLRSPVPVMPADQLRSASPPAPPRADPPLRADPPPPVTGQPRRPTPPPAPSQAA
jgi:hypothetical protein